MTARITYNSVNVDFDIKYDSLDVKYTQNRNQNRSLSGKIETINLHGIMQINFQTLLTVNQYRDMVGFYSWARQGKTFSFSPHSSLTGNATLNGNATESLIPVTTTGGFSTGDYCMIRAADDDEFEIVQISGLTGTGASVSSTLIFDYASGDHLRHQHYFPSAILVNTDFNPREMDGSDYYRFDFQIIEAL